MNYRLLVCLLFIFPTMISAMQIHPEGAQQKKGWCSWICSCCRRKTQAEKDAQAARQKVLLSAQSGDLRRATGGKISEEAIKKIKAEQKKFKEKEQIQQKAQHSEGAAHQVAAATVRVVTPLGFLSPVLAIDPHAPKLSARASTQLNTPQTPQLPMSPTPAAHLIQAPLPALQVEDV